MNKKSIATNNINDYMTNYKENYKFTSRHEDEKGDWTSDEMVVRLKKCNVRGKEILANQRDFPHEEPRYNCTRQKAQKNHPTNRKTLSE